MFHISVRLCIASFNPQLLTCNDSGQKRLKYYPKEAKYDVYIEKREDKCVSLPESQSGNGEAFKSTSSQTNFTIHNI